jgi:hypothetical protein
VQHIPLIMSGPGIRQSIHSQFPARSIDIAPTIERLLGLPAIHRDGVILADALVNPTGVEVAPQRTVAPSLVADVTALQAQSNFDDLGLRRWPQLPPPLHLCSVTPGAHKSGCKTVSPAPTDQ